MATEQGEGVFSEPGKHAHELDFVQHDADIAVNETAYQANDNEEKRRKIRELAVFSDRHIYDAICFHENCVYSEQ